MRAASTQAAPPPTADDQQGAAQAPAEDAFDKGGNFKICFKWPYWFIDADYGDDHLNEPTPTTEGHEPARYALFALFNSAQQIIPGGWGNLDASGCTPNINHPNGTYTGFVTTSLYRPASDVLIDVTVDETQEFLWGGQQYTINTSGGTKTLTLNGAWPLVNATVAAANTIFRATPAYLSGVHTDIFAGVPCPPIPGQPPTNAGCNLGAQIYLGQNNFGVWRADFKVVVTHELGHRISSTRWGQLGSPCEVDPVVRTTGRGS